MPALTPALDQHLAKLRVYGREHRTFPVITDQASGHGKESKNGVNNTLNRLVQAGFLESVGTP